MAGGASGGWFPTRSTASAGAPGIEPKSCNGHENMAIANEDTDPVSVSFFPVVEESAGGHLALHESGFAEDVGNGAGAIVAGVIKPGMASAPFVGLVLESVSGCDGKPDSGGGSRRSIGDAISQNGGLAALYVSHVPGRLLLAAARSNGEWYEEGEKEAFHGCEIGRFGLLLNSFWSLNELHLHRS